jgi:crotonobetainyl-CoA:carnitine CoA-transferase CaiB-like acyl-CoA transferase
VDRPLASLVVVDLSQGLSGAYATKLFADAGAQVVLGEPPLGSSLRNVSEPGEIALFEYLSHGKQSVIVASWAETMRLARVADVVVEDGLSDEQLDELLDVGRIVVSISAFGRTGPFAPRTATEFTIQAESGCLATRGDKAEAPFQAGGHIVEWVSGSYAAVAGLAASRGDGSEHIDVSMMEVAVLTGTNFLSVSHQLLGEPELSEPVRVVESPEIHASADGWVGFTTNSGQQFQDFLVMIDRGDLLDDVDLATAAGRQRRLKDFRSIVAEWTGSRTTSEIVELASALRIPVAPVLNGQSVLDFDHFASRRAFVRSPSGFTMPRRPWRLDDEDPPPAEPSPVLGSGSRPLERSPQRRRPSRLPLEGMRVVDLTAWWAGPTATHLLACLGAEVCHIESPTRPDGMRMTGGVFSDKDAWWERSSFFLTVNTNKSDLAIDLASDQGRDVLLKLIATADVVIENFTPRVLSSLHLDWDTIVRENPRCSLIRMPAFGLSGPWRDAPGFAQTMEQVSGLAWLTGFADSQPHNQRGPTDPNGGIHAAFGALVAMAARDLDGKGHHVESTFAEVALSSAARSIIEYSVTGRILERDGNRDGVFAPQGIYPTCVDEEWVALSVEDDGQWLGLVSLIGSDSPRSWTREDRHRHHDEIDREIEDWTRTRKRGDVTQGLDDARVTFGEVNDPRLLGTHPQLRQREFFESVAHDVVGEIELPTLPFRFRSLEKWIRMPAPLFGQDNRRILEGTGIDLEGIAALRTAGVISERPVGL